MAIVNGYVDSDDLKDWIGIKLVDTLDDNDIDRAITAASRGIDNYCQRQFWQATAVARVFDTSDPWLLDIDDLVSITSLKTDAGGDGTFETTWSPSDYQLLPLNPAAGPEPRPYQQIKAVGARTFPQPAAKNSRAGLIEITGTWGWPAVPQSISQACLLVATRLLKRKDSPEGVSGFDEFGVIRISSRDDPDAVRHLDYYWNASRVGV